MESLPNQVLYFTFGQTNPLILPMIEFFNPPVHAYKQHSSNGNNSKGWIQGLNQLDFEL
jgi:hypothetical protein